MKNKNEKGMCFMSNTLAVLNNIKGAGEIEMLSPQVVDMINGFRAEEGNRKVLQHKDFMRSTRKEIEALKNAGVEVGERNISPAEYIDSQGKKTTLLQNEQILDNANVQ